MGGGLGEVIGASCKAAVQKMISVRKDSGGSVCERPVVASRWTWVTTLVKVSADVGQRGWRSGGVVLLHPCLVVVASIASESLLCGLSSRGRTCSQGRFAEDTLGWLREREGSLFVTTVHGRSEAAVTTLVEVREAFSFQWWRQGRRG